MKKDENHSRWDVVIIPRELEVSVCSCIEMVFPLVELVFPVTMDSGKTDDAFELSSQV